MLSRVFAIALNAYREAVRARILYGLLGLALATVGYSLVVATLSLHQEARVVADVGAGSISLYAVIVAIVLGATSLHRELELKTVFPILTRKLRRHEYLVGKYFGMLMTLAVFVAIDAATVLGVLAFETGQKPWLLVGTVVAFAAALAIGLVRAKHTRVFVVIPWAFALLVAMAILGATAGAERQLVLASAVLTVCEVAIITALATLFASFSSPFLTAVFTLFIFLIGRSVDTLGNLPPKVFSQTLHDLGRGLTHVFPNLEAFVPPRPLLLGQVPGTPVWGFVLTAALHAFLYSTFLLTASALVFQKRDFQ
jgi:ABC-type transport system involved in multi-copper enzyme maturation permease subunit